MTFEGGTITAKCMAYANATHSRATFRGSMGVNSTHSNKTG